MNLGFHNKHLYTINSMDIVSQDNVQDLGVYITSDLSWHQHRIMTATKINGVATAILHSFTCQDVNIYMILKSGRF